MNQKATKFTPKQIEMILKARPQRGPKCSHTIESLKPHEFIFACNAHSHFLGSLDVVITDFKQTLPLTPELLTAIEQHSAGKREMENLIPEFCKKVGISKKQLDLARSKLRPEFRDDIVSVFCVCTQDDPRYKEAALAGQIYGIDKARAFESTQTATSRPFREKGGLTAPTRDQDRRHR